MREFRLKYIKNALELLQKTYHDVLGFFFFECMHGFKVAKKILLK